MSDGVVVLGGEYRGLGVVQSLGRRGIAAVVLYEHRRDIARYSRYVSRALRWPGVDEELRMAFLLDLADRQGLHGWTLVPTGDETAAMCARKSEQLRSVFRVSVPPWEIFRWAYDKRLTRRLAADLGVDFPQTWEPALDGLDETELRYPLIVKPAMKASMNELTIAKAWRVDDLDALKRRLGEASRLMPLNEVLVQELIPGDGTNQLSFAALAAQGQLLATMVAQRTRQYPMDFGRASTFVETVEDRDVEHVGSRLLGAIDYTGLIEIEFKRDPSTGALKLLDMNARVWGWHTLGRRAGVDFSLLLWRLLHGEKPAGVKARAGVRWMWPAADIPTVLGEIVGRRLRVRDYARDFRRPIDFATLVIDDPVPGLLEVPLQVAARLKRRTHGADPVVLPSNAGAELPVA